MKAMILAAGCGTRLQPLTTITPKPLVMVGNTTFLGRLLHQLSAAGATEVVINVHHLAEQIIDYCGDGARFGLPIRFSVEETRLETGGGIVNALPLLGDDPFLVVSADIWTDYPFKKLMQKPVKNGHLVFVNNPAYHVSGDYALDQAGIVRDDLTEKLTYGNIALLHPTLFANRVADFFKLNEVFRSRVLSRELTGEYYDGAWFNIGTEAELHALRALHNTF